MKQLSYLPTNSIALFHYFPLQYMLRSLSQNRLSQVYVDNAEEPSFCVLAWKYGYALYIGGEMTKERLAFVQERITKRKAFVNVFYPDATWYSTLRELYPEQSTPRERSLYSIVPHLGAAPPENPQVLPITAELMASEVANKEMLYNEITTYADFNAFLRDGFGYALVIDNTIYGFCTSEYPAMPIKEGENGEIAIGIEVARQYQRQGYAKAMTLAFLHQAALRGLTVYWDCWKSNIASANTALSCGFAKVADYSTLDIR